jgi:hypothetical protein
MVAELQAMVAAAPEDARLHVDLGLAYSFHSRPDLAIGEMRRAVALDDTLEEAWDRLALLAAAGADSTVSPAEVVAWAERACQLSQDENAGRLDTLALAKARAGDVQGALTAARKGLVIARRLGPAEQVQRLRARIGELTHPPPGRS